VSPLLLNTTISFPSRIRLSKSSASKRTLRMSSIAVLLADGIFDNTLSSSSLISGLSPAYLRSLSSRVDPSSDFLFIKL